MVAPGVFFNTSSQGTIPISPTVKNRIGIIGRFNRGVVGIPTYGLGDNDVNDRYSLDDSPGALAYRAARSQGAEDFALVRVLGQERSACASLSFNGIVSVDNTLRINVKNLSDIELLNVTDPLGQVFLQAGTYPGEDPTTTTFANSETGTLYLYVSRGFTVDLNDPSLNTIGVKYYFSSVAEGIDPLDIDWTAITDEISVDLAQPSFTIENIEIIIDPLANDEESPLAQVGELYSLEISNFVYEVPLLKNQIPSQVVDSVIDVLNSTIPVGSGATPVGEVIKTTDNDGTIICLNETVPGSDGNFYELNFTVDLVEPTLTINNQLLNASVTRVVNFTGGVAGARNAFVDFYSIEGIPLLRVLAASPGDWGNQLRVTVFPIDFTTFRLSVEDLGQTSGDNTESFLLDFKDTNAEGYLNQLNNAKYIRGIFLPKYSNVANFGLYESFSPLRLAVADPASTNVDSPTHPDYFGINFLKEVPLQDGYEGPTIDDSDFIAAIKSLESFPAHIIITDGYTSPAIENVLITHANNAKELEGLRITALPTPKYMSPALSKNFITGKRNQRAVGVAGWITFSDAPNAPRFSVPATALYAGILGGIPQYVSPAARGIIPSLLNVAEVDIAKYNNSVSLDLYAVNGLEVLALDPTLLSYSFSTGNTLSSDPNWLQISSVRTFDYIRQDVFRLMQQFKSQPHTADLRRQAATSIDTYLETLRGNGEIANFLPTKITAANNSKDDYISRRLNIELRVLELFAADFTIVSLIKDTTLDLGFIEG